MSTNALSDGTESSAPIKFYAPAASGASYGAGRVERFLTGLYDRHRFLTRQTE